MFYELWWNMRLRKFVLACCMIISVFLFVNGMLILSSESSRLIKNPYGEYEPLKKDHITEEYGTNPNNPVNLIVRGLDGEEVRSDVILLFNINPGEGKINILSIARDTKVQAKGKTTKMNALIGMGGERLTAEVVGKLTGLPIHYYLTLNFKGFRKLIDTLGGVEFNVPFNMNYDDPEQNLHIHLKKGKQVLNGKKAEQFVRYRKGNISGQGYRDGDIGRINMQQEFIKELIKQKQKLKYLSKIDDVYFILKENMSTNIEIGDIKSHLRDIMNIKYDEIKSFTIPGDSKYINNIWYFVCDEEKTKELVDSNFFK